MRLNTSEYIAGVKSFLRQPAGVTEYDNEITSLINSALRTLSVAGIEDQTEPLALDYINTYVRLRMLRDASDNFRQFETAREKQLLLQLTYGDADHAN